MTILVAVEEFRIGGAQTFALRLAQALYEAGHRVYLYSMYWQYTEYELVRRLAPDVELLEYQPSYQKVDTLVLRADDWLQRQGLDISLRARKLQRHLEQLIGHKKIEVVSSNTFKCDHLLAEVLQKFPLIPLVVTMHGDYEQFLAFYRQGQHYVIPNYLHKLADTIARVNGIAYLSEQNLEVIRPGVVTVSAGHVQVRRIYNGLEGRFSSDADKYTRLQLKIGQDALVFGMVARGVPEKGWEPVIKAFQRLRQSSTRPMNLVLVGASSFLDQLREVYRADETLRFLGFVNNPVDCIASFDVGILASSLKESLPNSIAEYLFCGKGVISTDVGEIRQMIRTDDGQEAGLLIDFPVQGLADVEPLYQTMKRYAEEENLLRSHQGLAARAFAKFEMSRCVQAYTQLYEDCAKSLSV